MKKSLLLMAALMAAGTMVAQSDLGYTPIVGDYEVTIPSCSGVYINNGFSISLFGTPIDKDGFIDGPGDLVNLEFYTEEPGSENFSIAGVYNYYDTEAWMDKTTDVKFGPGDLMGGFIYEIMPGYAIPMGTLVTVYDEDMNESLGLAGPESKLIVTDKGNGVYNLAIDFYTVQNAHITGEWEGVLTDYVKDCPELSGLNSAMTDNYAPEYYNLQGMKVQNPTPGQIYIQYHNGSTTKVLK